MTELPTKPTVLPYGTARRRPRLLCFIGYLLMIFGIVVATTRYMGI